MHECIQLVTQRNLQNKKKKGYIRCKQNWQLVFSCDKMRWFKTDGEILKFRHLLSWHGISMVGAKLSSFTLLFNLFRMAGKTSRQRPPARWGRRENWWLGGMGKWYPSVSWCHRSSHKRGYPVCGLTSRNEDTPPWADVINRNTPICGLTSWKRIHPLKADVMRRGLTGQNVRRFYGTSGVHNGKVLL